MRIFVATVLLTAAMAARATAQDVQTDRSQPPSPQNYSDMYRGYSTAQWYGPGNW
jgi:hypothetical protein